MPDDAFGGLRAFLAHHALIGAVFDRQVDDAGHDPKNDADPPNNVVGSGHVKQNPTEPNPQKGAKLMGEEHDSKEHAHMAHAKEIGDQA